MQSFIHAGIRFNLRWEKCVCVCVGGGGGGGGGKSTPSSLMKWQCHVMVISYGIGYVGHSFLAFYDGYYLRISMT